MKLIAESGSTKTIWKLKTDDKVETFETIGFNPLFISISEIKEELGKSEIVFYKDKIKEIYFYGASCSSDSRKKVIHDGLSFFFINAEIIYVDHDLNAACIGLFGNQKGIACILGTGSNSCIWDGEKVVENIEALGYILGDEAGGAWFGKKIVSMYLYKRLPAHIAAYVAEHYHSDKNDIYNAVYAQKFPNRYLASYAKILSVFREDAFVQDLLDAGFEEFIQFHILPYASNASYTWGFVGSIAYYFQEELTRACHKHGARNIIIQKSPVDGLFAWHSK